MSVVDARLGKDKETASSATSRIQFTVEVDFDSFQAQKEAERAEMARAANSANVPRAPEIGL